MGKGQAAKRRLANALRANQGNLHKAQFRKATKNLPLPNAPSEQDFKERVPASLRKLQLLKAVAAGERPTANVQREAKKQQREGKRKAAHKAAAKGRQQAEAGRQAEAGKQDDAAGASTAEQPKSKLKAGQDAPLPYEEPEKESAGKARKKEYMRQKDRKRKQKVADADLPVEKELELKQKAHTTAAKFGEQAHAPPVVNLKRKHWEPQTAQAAASARCKRVFTKQMEDARRRAAALTDGVSDGGASAGLPGKQKALAGAERDALRHKVIAAYRQQRQAGQQQGSSANMDTLAQLVQRNNKEKEAR